MWRSCTPSEAARTHKGSCMLCPGWSAPDGRGMLLLARSSAGAQGGHSRRQCTTVASQAATTAAGAGGGGGGAQAPAPSTQKAGCETRACRPVMAMLPSFFRWSVAQHIWPWSSDAGIPSRRARSTGIGLVIARLRLWLKAYSRPIRCCLVLLSRRPWSSRVCEPRSAVWSVQSTPRSRRPPSASGRTPSSSRATEPGARARWCMSMSSGPSVAAARSPSAATSPPATAAPLAASRPGVCSHRSRTSCSSSCRCEGFSTSIDTRTHSPTTAHGSRADAAEAVRPVSQLPADTSALGTIGSTSGFHRGWVTDSTGAPSAVKALANGLAAPAAGESWTLSLRSTRIVPLRKRGRGSSAIGSARGSWLTMEHSSRRKVACLSAGCALLRNRRRKKPTDWSAMPRQA
mmetsp:Transcript_30045/g.96928  ORF Transcript_30045/g.96928 Transcript_30045/m.96928 type:complete len:403 (-) Transcript_30045:1624-2832(-)|eukprot:scaffold5584_cov110-Isochrysis_galbana.AAC.5